MLQGIKIFLASCVFMAMGAVVMLLTPLLLGASTALFIGFIVYIIIRASSTNSEGQ